MDNDEKDLIKDNDIEATKEISAIDFSNEITNNKEPSHKVGDHEKRPVRRGANGEHRRPNRRPEHGPNRRPSGDRKRDLQHSQGAPDRVRRGDQKKRPAQGGKKIKKKGWSKKKKAILIASIVIGFLLIVIGIIVGVIYHYINMIDIVTDDESFELLSSIEPDERDKNHSLPDSPEEDKKALEEALRRNLEENEKELMSDDNVFNILLIGCDARSKSGRGRSDSMILLSINKEKEKVVMTSFLRDTWVSIPDVGPQRLNAAYVFGGPKLLIRTIQSNFGIRIDKYARVNFYSFMEAIDAIGGVDIEVTDEELEYLNDYSRHQNKLLGLDTEKDILQKAGKYTLNGVQALAYARIRYVGTDFARTQRQRTVMNEIFRKAKNLSLTELNDFLEKVLPNVTTNLEKGEIFSMILHASSYLSYERTEQSIPNLRSFKNMVIDGMMVLGIDFDKYKAELKQSIYG